MISEISKEADENYRMIAVKVSPDHRVQDNSVEFRIDPSWFKDLIKYLDQLAKDPKDNNEEEDKIYCEYGEEGCDADDVETMCDGHRNEAAERRSEGMQETYDF